MHHHSGTGHEPAAGRGEEPVVSSIETRKRGRGGKTDSGTHVVEHPTVAQRTANGKAARAELPREAHADWEPPSDRPDPVGLLEEQAASRVAELVPIRYG